MVDNPQVVLNLVQALIYGVVIFRYPLILSDEVTQRTFRFSPFLAVIIRKIG
jgi:hypothetical protein